ncbi:hypothetical protein [Sphingomonas jaspsi]|nr:hypothetical protein [Sphingomonas jaspsi]
MSVVVNDTGLPSSTTQKYRVVARIATNNPSAGASLSLTGKVEITVP